MCKYVSSTSLTKGIRLFELCKVENIESELAFCANSAFMCQVHWCSRAVTVLSISINTIFEQSQNSKVLFDVSVKYFNLISSFRPSQTATSANVKQLPSFLTLRFLIPGTFSRILDIRLDLPNSDVKVDSLNTLKLQRNIELFRVTFVGRKANSLIFSHLWCNSSVILSISRR